MEPLKAHYKLCKLIVLPHIAVAKKYWIYNFRVILT